jgi:hypothetical protein
MVDEIRCPSCGHVNDARTVLRYRMCAECGEQIDVPEDMDELIKAHKEGEGPPPYAAPAPGMAPPPYGAPPPGHPPVQGYPPPPGAPYPYPQPYYPGYAPIPSRHPGVYDKPEQEPFIDFGALFKLLFKPKDTFRELYNHTNAMSGIILVVVFTLISTGYSFAIAAAFFPDLGADAEEQDEDNPFAGLGETPLDNPFWAGLSFVLGIVSFVLVALLVHVIVKSSKEALKPDRDKTIGLLGYAYFPGFVIGFLTTPLSLMMTDALAADTEAGAFPTEACGILLAFGVIAIIAFIWELWIQGHAVSVANDTTLGMGVVFIFISGIIIGIVIAGISAAITIAVAFG